MPKIVAETFSFQVGQSYTFHEGDTFFSSKFYDTKMNDYLNDTFDQDIHESSVFFRTTYSQYVVVFIVRAKRRARTL